MTESVAVDVPTTADRWLVWREPPRGDHRRRAAAKEVGAGRDRSTERSVSAEPAPASKHPMPTFGEEHVARPGRAGTSIHVRARVVAGRGVAAYVRKGSQPDGSLVAALLAEQRNADDAGAVLRFVRGRQSRASVAASSEQKC
jgi:hypothetical protein